MKDIIIIYNNHDKICRNFINIYGNRNDVILLEDDGSSIRLKYPFISILPTVIINTPSYVESFIIDTNGGGAYVNLNLDEKETKIPAGIEYISNPKDWSKVEERINYWETKVPNWKATDSRYK